MFKKTYSLRGCIYTAVFFAILLAFINDSKTNELLNISFLVLAGLSTVEFLLVFNVATWNSLFSGIQEANIKMRKGETVSNGFLLLLPDIKRYLNMQVDEKVCGFMVFKYAMKAVICTAIYVMYFSGYFTDMLSIITR